MPLTVRIGEHKTFPRYFKINFRRGPLFEIYINDAVLGSLRLYPCSCTDHKSQDVCSTHAPWYDRLLRR